MNEDEKVLFELLKLRAGGLRESTWLEIKNSF